MKHLIEIVGIVPILWVSMDMGISHVLYILYRFSTLHQRLDLMFLILIVILSSAVLFLITWSLSNGVDTNLTYLSVFLENTSSINLLLPTKTSYLFTSNKLQCTVLSAQE